MFSCQKNIKDSNALKLFDSLKTENFEEHNFIFNKDTIIKTGKGNKIHLILNDFKIPKNRPITLNIEEYTKRLDLILNNIPTVTNENELLESKIVFKTTLFCEKKHVKLKDGKKIKITLNGNINEYKNYNLYEGSIDSIGRFSWKERDKLFTMFNFDLGAGIYYQRKIPLDSVNYYQKQSDSIKKIKPFNVNDEKSIAITMALFNNNVFINVDKLVKNISKKKIVLNCKNKDNYVDYILFVLYENINSFTTYHVNSNDLSIDNVLIQNNAKGIIVTYAKEKVLYDEFVINKNTKTLIDVNLTEIGLDKFKELLTGY